MMYGRMLCDRAVGRPRLRLHVDADRDGAVDNAYRYSDTWNWGNNGHGAVIRCNDNDGPAGRTIPALHVPSNQARAVEADPRAQHAAPGGELDNSNQQVNGANDLRDIAPLEVRRYPAAVNFPAGWTARISVPVADQNKVRIFNGIAAGSAEVIGPTTGAVHNFPIGGGGVAFPMTFGMEGTQYWTQAWKGKIRITLEVLDNHNNVRDREHAKVRVAPWMIGHHLNPVTDVYVLNEPSVAHGAFRAALAAPVGGANLRTALSVNYAGDRWFRDIMKVGYSSVPHGAVGPAWNVHSVLRTANDRRLTHNHSLLDRYPWREMIGANIGYTTPLYPYVVGSSLDSFGNLECSPPVRVGGRRYRFGRIVYGHDPMRPMQQAVRDFLAAQRIQRPFPVDTSWLDVGHVDEVFSFCPMPSAPHGFKVLIASPNEARTILNNLNLAGNGAATLFGPHTADPNFSAVSYPDTTVAAILGNVAFMALQTTAQGHIDTIKQELRTNLGLANTDFIEIPLMFRDTGAGLLAYTPGTVNMLVVSLPGGTANLAIPDPFGPVVGLVDQFKLDINNKLAADYVVAPAVPGPNQGTIHYIDDFFTYHDLMGEIHCGTNEVRTPVVNEWWWRQKWW
jgi:hypothetical protein